MKRFIKVNEWNFTEKKFDEFYINIDEIKRMQHIDSDYATLIILKDNTTYRISETIGELEIVE